MERTTIVVARRAMHRAAIWRSTQMPGLYPVIKSKRRGAAHKARFIYPLLNPPQTSNAAEEAREGRDCPKGNGCRATPEDWRAK